MPFGKLSLYVPEFDPLKVTRSNSQPVRKSTTYVRVRLSQSDSVEVRSRRVFRTDLSHSAQSQKIESSQLALDGCTVHSGYGRRTGGAYALRTYFVLVPVDPTGLMSERMRMHEREREHARAGASTGAAARCVSRARRVRLVRLR